MLNGTSIPLKDAAIERASMLGPDVLLTFTNGTTVLLDGNDVKALALASAKLIVTEEDAANVELDA